MFLKSVLLGLRRKIGEPIMILLTVAIAVATFVSALALRDSVEERAIASYRAFAGSSALEASFSDQYAPYYITSDAESFSALKTESEKYGKLHAGYLFYASIGKTEESFAEVYATDREDLATYNLVEYLEGQADGSRTGVVLSETFARKIGAVVGDYLSATLYGSDNRFSSLRVTGVAKAKGLFSVVDVLASDAVASRLLFARDDVVAYNRIFIELSDQKINSLGVDVSAVTEALSAVSTDFEVASPVNDRNVKVTLSYQSTLLLVIAGIVAALGAVLIYTAVSLVMKNRLSVAARFKSVGATGAGLTLYLLAEVLLYGVVGSLVGVAGSYGVGALFGAMTSSSVAFSLGVGTAILGVLFGTALALLSALIPVLRLSLSPLYDLLRAASPILRVKPLPAFLAAGVFVALFFASAFVGVSAAFTVGIFAAVALLAAVFTVTPFAVKGASALLCRVTRDKPRVGKLYLASTGARSNRHAQSGARLLAVALLAVISIAVLLGEARGQLRSFDDLFRADIMISVGSGEISEVVAETRETQGITDAYAAYVENRCTLEGEEDNTVALFAARLQEYESVFRAKEFGVDLSSFSGRGNAAMGGGLAMKLGLSVGDTFAVTVNGKRTVFTLASLIDTPLTVVFTDLSGLGIQPNLCLAAGSEEGYSRLSQKFALRGAVYRASDAFDYVTDLAKEYIRVFTLFEVLVFLFAAAGYLNSALASFRDRKREYDLLSAAGASKSDLKKIVALENAVVTVAAAVIGAALSFALLFIVQNMLKSLGLYFTLLG